MKTLRYLGFERQAARLDFRYEWKDKSYIRSIAFEDSLEFCREDLDPAVRDRLIAHIGLSVAIEFLRLDRIQRIVVESPHFFEESATFFSDYFQAGLAELRYRNRIPLEEPIEFVFSGFQVPHPGRANAGGDALLCNGGGKDSAVAAEILRHAGVPFNWLSISATDAMQGIRELTGAQQIRVRHGIGKSEIRSAARFRGHVPFVPLVAAIGSLIAYLRDFSYVVVGNEYSANFGNLQKNGKSVNHQYGKSLDFENKYRDYVSRNLLSNVSYFSILAPFYELQIARVFSQYPQYFNRFVSCNIGHRKNTWCKRCPKCAFIFIVLAPYLSIDAISEIFGGNPWEEEGIRATIEEMVTGSRKPFECVGTFDETRVALHLTLQNNDFFRQAETRPKFASLLNNVDIQKLAHKLFHGHRSRPHNIPASIWPRVAAFMEAPDRSEQSTVVPLSRSHKKLLILSDSDRRIDFVSDPASMLLLSELERSGIECQLHCPWEKMVQTESLLGVLSWSRRPRKNNFSFWVRKAEESSIAAGVPVLGGSNALPTNSSRHLAAWKIAGLVTDSFQCIRSSFDIALPFPLLLKSNSIDNDRKLVFVQTHREARQEIASQLDSRTAPLDLAIGMPASPKNASPQQAFVIGDQVLLSDSWSSTELRILGERDRSTEIFAGAACALRSNLLAIDYCTTADGRQVLLGGNRIASCRGAQTPLPPCLGSFVGKLVSAELSARRTAVV